MTIRMIVRGAVKSDKADAYTAWADRATTAAKQEPGMVTYQCFLSDTQRFINEEVYADEAAFFAHSAAIAETGALEEFMGLVELEELVLLDPVNDEMRQALAAFGAVNYTRAP